MSASLYFKTANDGYINSGLNMANSNASAFLAALGLDPNFWESDPAPISELADAIRLFNPEFVDGGTETVESQEQNSFGQPVGPKMIQCGRRPGYMTEKVELARQAVDRALARGATHFYFG
jgi:hypothetical protein